MDREVGGGRAPALGGCLGPQLSPYLPAAQSLLLPGYLLTKYLFYQQQQLPDDWGRPEVASRGEAAHCPQEDLNWAQLHPLLSRCQHHSVGFPTERRPVTIQLIPMATLEKQYPQSNGNRRERPISNEPHAPWLRQYVKAVSTTVHSSLEFDVSERETLVNESFHKRRLPLSFPKAGFQTLKSINNSHKKNACIGFSSIQFFHLF